MMRSILLGKAAAGACSASVARGRDRTEAAAPPRSAIRLRRDVGKERRRCVTIDPAISRDPELSAGPSMAPASRHIQQEARADWSSDDRTFGRCYHSLLRGGHAAYNEEA